MKYNPIEYASIIHLRIRNMYLNKDENVHRFALSALRGELLEIIEIESHFFVK